MEAFQCSACNFTTFEIEHLLQHVCVSASGKLMAFLFQSFTRLPFEKRSKHSDEGKLVSEVKAIRAML